MRAASEHKPLLVDFGATWCGACKELDEKTFPDARVRAEGSRFVPLHVDATDDDDPEVARPRPRLSYDGQRRTRRNSGDEQNEQLALGAWRAPRLS